MLIIILQKLLFTSSSPYPSEGGRTPHRSGGGGSTTSGKMNIQNIPNSRRYLNKYKLALHIYMCKYR